MTYTIHTDGGARGNPGPAAIGVVVEAEKKEIAGFGKTIGETTNNVAEYTAVIEALRWLINYPITKLSSSQIIQFYLDSTLVVNQLNGVFRVKDAKLRELLLQVRALEQQVRGTIIYDAIPREQNSRADYFVNKALDESV